MSYDNNGSSLATFIWWRLRIYRINKFIYEEIFLKVENLVKRQEGIMSAFTDSEKEQLEIRRKRYMFHEVALRYTIPTGYDVWVRNWASELYAAKILDNKMLSLLKVKEEDLF